MKSYSQANQDKWVQYLFLEREPENCFFLDIGANDGITINNTLALELAGWKGICVEPNRIEFLKLIQNRKVYCSNFVISDVCGYSGFKENGLLGEIQTGNTHISITMKELLRNCPNKIQYLSLDVEGNEYTVLKEFPFENYIVEAITVEHNAYLGNIKLKTDIFNLLSSKGYIRVKDNVLVDSLYPFEDWYVHETLKYR